jgi:hypothetical protein
MPCDFFTYHASRITLSILPIEGFFFDGVDVAYEQNTEKSDHRSEDEVGVVPKHFLVNDRPRVKKNNFDIEKDKKHRDQVKLDGHPSVSAADGEHTAFIGRVLDRIPFGPFAQEHGNGQRAESKRNGKQTEYQDWNVLRQLIHAATLEIAQFFGKRKANLISGLPFRSVT